jgi:hypothetical protein
MLVLRICTKKQVYKGKRRPPRRKCMCVCVCVCVYIYFYLYLYIYACICICLSYAYVQRSKFIRASAGRHAGNAGVYVYACICIWVCTHMYSKASLEGQAQAAMQEMHTNKYIRAYIRTYTHIHTYMYRLCKHHKKVSHNCFYYTSKPECAIPDDNSQKKTKKIKNINLIH